MVMGVGVACGARSSIDRTLHPPPADSDVVRACIMFYACGGPTGLFTPSPNTVSGCIALTLGTASVIEGGATMINTGFLETEPVACLAAATDCAGVDACMFGDSTGCASSPSSAFCVQNHAVHCNGLGPFSDDCSAPGLLRDGSATCLSTVDGNVACAFGRCDPTTTPACDGMVTEQCNNGLLNRWTCPAGTTCGGGGQIGCTGSGAPCSADQCDGATLAICLNGGELRIDCRTLPIPSICTVTSSAVTCTPSPELACDPMEFIDTCDGTTLHYCDGDRRAFDCATLGLGCGSSGGTTSCE